MDLVSSPSNLPPVHAPAEAHVSSEGPGGRVVVAAIGAFDDRASVAASVAQSMSATQRVALHVAVDTDEARAVGLQWMSQPRGLALQIVDDEIGAATPLQALLSSAHETQYSRLFRS